MNFRILGPKGNLVARAISAAKLAKSLPGLVKRFGRVQIAKVLPPRPITMYDSVSLSTIPPKAEAVAGYVGGHWPTYKLLAERWPKAKRLSIAVNAMQDAECLDVEQGDASNTDAPSWYRRQKGRGIKRPVIYTSVSNANALLAALRKTGIQRSQIRLWTAHYTGKKHRCTSACGFGMVGTADATQYDDHTLGRSLDVSTCAPDFFD